MYSIDLLIKILIISMLLEGEPMIKLELNYVKDIILQIINGN